MTVQGGCSAVQTPRTLQIFGSDKLARKRTSRSDSIEPVAASLFALSGLGVRTATKRHTPGIMSSKPSVSQRVIWKCYDVIDFSLAYLLFLQGEAIKCYFFNKIYFSLKEFGPSCQHGSI
jgi:hypothetical protein